MSKLEITATVSNAKLVLHVSGIAVMIGNISGDSKSRFEDGEGIRTSAVKNIQANEEGQVLVVTNNSVYAVEGELTVDTKSFVE